MANLKVRAEIIVSGLVQGVGFRYFVLNKARELNLVGFVKNQFDGTVLTVVEGSKNAIQLLLKFIEVGPMHAQVNKVNTSWSGFVSEFSTFEIRRY